MTVGPMVLIWLLSLALTTGGMTVTTDDAETEVPAAVIEQLEAIVIAAHKNELAVLTCTHHETGEPVYTLCAVHENEEDKTYNVAPIAALDGADPYEFVVPPKPFTHDKTKEIH